MDRSVLQSFGLYGSCVGERTRVPFPFCLIDAFKPTSLPCIVSEKLKNGDNNNKKGAVISSWPLPQYAMVPVIFWSFFIETSPEISQRCTSA